MEDDLKKNEKMEDDLRNKNKNGRRPQKNGRQPKKKKIKLKKRRRMKTTSKKMKKMKTTSKKNKKKMKTTSKKNLFLIPLKFRGKPFLGLAQLSQIFLYNSVL